MSDKYNSPEKSNRRQFLKKLGIGAASLGAFSMMPASAFKVRSPDFEFFGTDNTAEISASDGVVDLSGSNRMRLPTVSGNPSTTSVGDIWYDTNAD